ncbi:hypothetical protein SAY87_005823 [Trapa incisa]|uniref:ACT domain-containing protein ACR n=1 Tax=Trapa incisa TaxID=236973 RepID=A0AAN7KD53_9MYRT|nr:hypothetical protein SAY87_005823 [Trapa incisa]
MMEIAYKPYIDANYESLIERIYPPRVCIDNETYQDCTLVKVTKSLKTGKLKAKGRRRICQLEMVQVLTDLDLVISKSYISSDGRWFMDVFHVTDQLGNKLTDEGLIHYIQQALGATRNEGLQRVADRFKSRHVSTEHTILEMSGMDRPGLLSEISAVLAELDCHIAAAEAWTHNGRTACVIYVDDGANIGRPIVDPNHLTRIEVQLENVMEAHHHHHYHSRAAGVDERQSVRVTDPVVGRTHTERRLHQLMFVGGDYQRCGCSCRQEEQACSSQECDEPHVSIEGWKGKGYSVVNIKSRDRPKLLFDTVCAITDMDYVVSHAALRSEGIMANQEYFIRPKDGCTLNEESEKRMLTKSLISAIEGRLSHGLRVDVSTHNRKGLLSEVTRVLRENGLSIPRAEIRTPGNRAIGSFYVMDAAGEEIDPGTLELIRKEIGGSVLMINKSSSGRSTPRLLSASSTISMSGSIKDHKPRLSLGGLIWLKLERLSGNLQ